MFWLLIPFLFAALLLLTGLVWQVWADQRDRGRMPPPGRMVMLDDRRIHLLEAGAGRPTVVFDSAMAGTSLSWEWVQPEVARFTATVSTDRAGFGWSDPGPPPRDAGRCADDLFRALRAAGAAPPYILVGHSYGGLVARLFADRHPESTAGLVLVDSADVNQWATLGPEDRRKIENGARLARRGVWVARLGLARFVIWMGGRGAMAVARQLGSWLSRGTSRPVQDRLLAPLERVSPETRRALAWFWSRPGFYQALAEQIEQVPESARMVAAAGPQGDLPLTVISAPNAESWWLPAQQQLAELSTRGRHIVAENSSHWIPLDRPDLIVSAIREMVEAARKAPRI